jgi:hypothetical protein
MSGFAQRAADAARKAAAAARQQLDQAPAPTELVKSVSLRAGAVVDSATNNPQVKQALQQVQAASDLATKQVDHNYRSILKTNQRYVLGAGPSFFVNKDNVWRYAVFTTLAECAAVPIPCCRSHLMCLTNCRRFESALHVSRVLRKTQTVCCPCLHPLYPLDSRISAGYLLQHNARETMPHGGGTMSGAW